MLNKCSTLGIKDVLVHLQLLAQVIVFFVNRILKNSNKAFSIKGKKGRYINVIYCRYVIAPSRLRLILCM